MAFVCLFNSSHKASTLSIGKDELTIKGDLRLESRNAYLRFDSRGFNSNSTSSLDLVSLNHPLSLKFQVLISLEKVDMELPPKFAH